MLYIYGRFRGGGGGHSDAKWEIFQFFDDFSKMSFCRGGGGMLYLFEISKKRRFRKGMGWGGGVGGHLFEIRSRTFPHFRVYRVFLPLCAYGMLQNFPWALLQHVPTSSKVKSGHFVQFDVLNPKMKVVWL